MNKLSWNQRFALIEHFEVPDDKACEVFDVKLAELKTARYLKENNGYFVPDKNINFNKYAHLFRANALKEIPKEEKTTQKPKKRTTQKARNTPPKKRGRKGTKIKTAFNAITKEPVPVEDFMAKYDVSLSVLRRHKNFDHIPEKGQVNVRKIPLKEGDKEKTLCIWRDIKDND